ncbi:unnamed protein product [Dibothriocephalus latus]|uniref:Uncharacterized protein n=1 Tax=Dibothriocephalus latus TaxID=60516 RepID=A0A3P6SJW3_DIBLA|nr:unnamed protein product [Dibothriocephalus latus]
MSVPMSQLRFQILGKDLTLPFNPWGIYTAAVWTEAPAHLSASSRATPRCHWLQPELKMTVGVLAPSGGGDFTAHPDMIVQIQVPCHRKLDARRK